MNRLWFRLSVGFSIAVLSASIIIMFAGLFIIRLLGEPLNARHAAAQVVEGAVHELTRFYDQHHTWDGVSGILEPDQTGAHPGLILSFTDRNGQLVYNGYDVIANRQTNQIHWVEGVPIVVDGQVEGYLNYQQAFFTLPHNWEPSLFRRWSQILTLIGLLTSTMGILFSVYMSRNLTAPLNRLADAARAIGDMKLSHRVAVEGTTEITQVAQAFNEMAQKLQESQSLQRNLVADVAHELRTPLSVLQGTLYAILDDVHPLNKEQITRLLHQSQIINRLVNDLQELSQAEAQQLRLNIQPVDVQQAVEEIVETLQPMADAENIHLACHIAAEMPFVAADYQRLVQIMHNLLANGLRYTPPHGRLRVCAGFDADSIYLYVDDTGPGIAAQHLDRVFERFYRVDAQNSTVTAGAGLGLAIVRALVEAHNGAVSVESAGVPGRGTTFIITLPRA